MVLVREVRPVYFVLSIAVFLTFIFVSLVSIRDPVHLKSKIQNHIQNFNIPLLNSPPSKPGSPPGSYDDAIRTLSAPFLHPIDTATFTDVDGESYTNPDEPIWTTSLGKDLCIIDVDTRPLSDENQVMNEKFNWQNIDGVSVGMLNHYLYATMHGYDYKFIHTAEWKDKARGNVWTKVPALREILKQYRIVVMIDADAVFRNLGLPYEWLLNRWNFTHDTSMAMPLDPMWDIPSGEKIGYTNNKYGEVNPNAGFITAQNLPRTFEMLDSWISCPDNEEEFPGCAWFRDGWPAEQGAFGEHIRYKFNQTTDFKAFNCTDGNGFPEQNSECRGLFVRHFTTGKDLLKNSVGSSVLDMMMARTHDELLRARVEG